MFSMELLNLAEGNKGLLMNTHVTLNDEVDSFSSMVK